MPPPRLSLCLARAESTRIRRIARADIAKKCAILPADVIDLDQPQIGFVDERRGLQGVPRTLPAHVPDRQPAQFGVNQWDEPVERVGLAPAPGKEERSGGLAGLHVAAFYASDPRFPGLPLFTVRIRLM